MPTLEKQKQNVMGKMARYNGDHDLARGVPEVSSTDMVILEALYDVIEKVKELEEKVNEQTK